MHNNNEGDEMKYLVIIVLVTISFILWCCLKMASLSDAKETQEK